MAPKEEKSAYDQLLREAKELSDSAQIPEDDAFSLEEILAEYGESRTQKLMADVEQEAEQPPAGAETARESKIDRTPNAAGAPEDDSREEDAPEASAETESEPAEKTPAGAGRAEDAEEGKLSSRPDSPRPGTADLPPPPQPISLEELMGSTVDAVLEEQTLLPEKKRRRGLFSRRRYVETEELYQRPESPPPPQEEPPEPIGPELPLDEAATECRLEEKRLRRPFPAAAMATALLAGLTAAQEEGISLPFWSDHPAVQTGLWLGVLGLVCILCRSVFASGWDKLRRRRCAGETLISLSAVLAAADCAARPFLPGRSDASPYVVVACAALTFALWGGARAARARYDAYRTAAMSEPPYLVTDTPQGPCKQPGHIEGFDTDLRKDDLPLQWQSVLVPVVLVAGLVFAALASVGRGRPQDFLLCWSAILAASSSFALPLGWSLPWSQLSRQLQKNGCAVAGWTGAEAISREKSMILTDGDLFPPGTVRFNGIKVFGEELPHAASYAASLVRASGSGLVRLFDELVRSERGCYYETDDFSFYEEGGYSATIRGEGVLLGTASFMRKMEVRLPDNLNLRTGLFLAVDHQLSAVFAVKYSAAENVDWALKMLRRNHITPILASRDPNITPLLLKRKFSKGVRVEYPSLASRVAFSEQEDGRGRPRALLLREGLLPYAETVAGSRRLCRAVRGGAFLGLLGSAAGALLSFYLTFLSEFSLMTPMALLIFLLLWMLPVLLLSGGCSRL